ncbi:hypothetical protein DY000_02037636 [Brassica cretica]|uniref:Gnk2-homologous domain-containing protein n=1 Tax=Brassica cretica TaxID=69181 RepID=A0ABQ7BKC9_BRACR|nr:hypothetical protein DY000_02037636 [Brassica cretica]
MNERLGRNFTSNTSYSINLNCLISSLPNLTPTINGFYNISIEGEVNAIALCRGDLKPNQDCINCITNTAKQLQESCPNIVESDIWLEKCMFRFTSRTILGQMEPVPFYHTSSNVSVADKESFSKGLGELLDSLGSKIVDAYDTSAGVKGIVYALAQCIPDLSKSDCRICLSQIFAGVPTCCDGQSVNGSKTLVFAVIPIVTIVLVVISLFIYLMRRKKNLKEEAESRLQDGQEIAVKRLSIHSGQGNAEFKTEILYSANECRSDPIKAKQLEWETRYNIIIGISSGYMAPEYAMHGRFSVKTDVYSFGVLVFEIITGKRNSGLGFSEGTDLPTFKLLCLVFKRILQKDQQWISAVSMLSSDSESLQLPKPSQPGFFRRSMSFSVSVNDVSLTDLSGR